MSKSFKNNSYINSQYAKTTCGGQNKSPHLSWSNIPKNTQSFALLCQDPDAPTAKKPALDPWIHWLLYDIPSDIRELEENVIPQTLNIRQGVNSWGNLYYEEPCPPKGSGDHRYIFTLYALDVPTIKNVTDTALLIKETKKHTLASAAITGKYFIQ